jgi:uncharacterized membrane protein (DUF4010 family)
LVTVDNEWLRLAEACAIGLLIGVERERNKGSGPHRAPAGIRTFAAAAVAGALGEILGGTLLLSALALGTAALLAVAYYRTTTNDPGLTTEIALLTTLLLGGLAIRNPALAGASGVAVAILLAAKDSMHRFVQTVLNQDEVNDALILAAASFIILPILPDRSIGPFSGLNPSLIWRLVILLMTIQAAGHVAARFVGTRYGLSVAGLIGGFVSSAATTNAMGAKAKSNPTALNAASMAALLSSVATFIQLLIIVGVTSRTALAVVAIPIVCGGLTIIAYSAFFGFRTGGEVATDYEGRGHAFDLKSALVVAVSLAAVFVLAAALDLRFGGQGATMAAGIAGFADAHAAAASVAALVAAGNMNARECLIPILIGLTTNTVSKATLAIVSGGSRFALRILPGLALSILATWLAAGLGFFWH